MHDLRSTHLSHLWSTCNIVQIPDPSLRIWVRQPYSLMARSSIDLQTYPSYTSSFGVYQGVSQYFFTIRSGILIVVPDFYVRKYITNTSPSAISFVVLDRYALSLCKYDTYYRALQVDWQCECVLPSLRRGCSWSFV